MKTFSYANAPDLRTALSILEKEKDHAYVVAGGTNVMVDIRAGKRNDKKLINIRDIEALKGIKYVRGKVVVGPLTTISELADSEIICEKAPVLCQAAHSFADPTTRNSATIGGNIADASPSADTATPLLVLKAEVVIEKKGAKRRVPIEEFFLGVRKTALQADELITAIEFAPQPKSAFYKLGLRNAMAISVASASAAVKCGRDGIIQECTLAMGSVAPKPVRCYTVEKALIGQKFSQELLDKAMEGLKKDISPIDDIRSTAEYRGGVAPALVKRVINRACGVCAQEGGN